MQRKLSTQSPIPTGCPGRGLVCRATSVGRAATRCLGIDRPEQQAAPPAGVPGVSTRFPDALN